MGKERYINRLNEIMTKYKLDGGFLHSTYHEGFETGNFESCYIDDRIKNGSKAKKEIAILLDEYFSEYTEVKKPLYSYK